MSNPHNPSGKQFDTAFLTAIADKMKAINGYFVIDEAYLDYGMAYDVEMAPHILRMRTLSKAFGIAGLRLGVLMSTAETIQRIQTIEHPYPLNVFTLNIATYIFRHREETRQFLTMQRQLAEQLKQIFDTHVADKMSVFPSHANFVLTKGSAAQQLGQYVYEQGFKPRFYDEPVMKGYVRYSIATASQLNQLEEIVKEWSAKYDLSKQRNTAETQLNISISDDQSPSHINTGVGFLNHMLTLFTFHSGLSLNIEAQGDIDVDDHHVTEDIGIVIGQLLLEMIKDKSISFVMEQCIFQWMKH